MAFGLFVLGLLSKTVTATLPAALLVIFWWQRGRLSWQRDVLPLVPFFVLGAVAGMLTAWVERKLIGAEGAAFDLTAVERCLIAGRAIWFYLGKLVWPRGLDFHLSALAGQPGRVVAVPVPRGGVVAVGGGVGAAAAMAGAAGGAALLRRHVVSGAGLLSTSILFLFSYVADHFQYLASSGSDCVGLGGAALLLERVGTLAAGRAGNRACLPLLAVLAVVDLAAKPDVHRHRDALSDDDRPAIPTCWMAYNELRQYHL